MERISKPGYSSNLVKVTAPGMSATIRNRGGELSGLETETSNGELYNIFYEGNEKNQKITLFPSSDKEVAQIKQLYKWDQANSLPGSTGWVYPQESWKGGENPVPPLTLNNAEYKSTLIRDSNRVTMTSPHCRETDVQSIRDFDFSKAGEGTIKVRHRLTNKGDIPVDWGIWTLDRLKPGGVVLLNGTREQLIKQKGDSIPEEKITPLKDGWIEISSKNMPFSKYGIVPNGRQPSLIYIQPIKEGKQGYAIFIKKSLQNTQDFPDDYDKNCPVEICFNPYDNLIEFELKGPLSRIQPGDCTREFVETRQLLYAESKNKLEALIRKQTGINYRYS